VLYTVMWFPEETTALVRWQFSWNPTVEVLEQIRHLRHHQHRWTSSPYALGNETTLQRVQKHFSRRNWLQRIPRIDTRPDKRDRSAGSTPGLREASCLPSDVSIIATYRRGIVWNGCTNITLNVSRRLRADRTRKLNVDETKPRGQDPGSLTCASRAFSRDIHKGEVIRRWNEDSNPVHVLSSRPKSLERPTIPVFFHYTVGLSAHDFISEKQRSKCLFSPNGLITTVD